MNLPNRRPTRVNDRCSKYGLRTYLLRTGAFCFMCFTIILRGEIDEKKYLVVIIDRSTILRIKNSRSMGSTYFEGKKRGEGGVVRTRDHPWLYSRMTIPGRP